MITALLIFLALTVIGAAAIKISQMEFLISSYYYNSEQAQQAADAGVDWTIEMIYNQLLDSRYDEHLPASLPLADPELPLGRVNIKNIEMVKQTAEQNGANYCLYSFECLGSYQEAFRNVSVVVEYTFSGGYLDSASFVPRDYLDRGIIRSYQLITN